MAKPINNKKEKLSLEWGNILIMSIAHLGAVYGIWLGVTSAKLNTVIFAFFLYIAAGFGITIGAHRLWAHQSFKAKFPFRFLMMILQTIACQLSVIHWAKLHRMHHKFVDTDADPHNSKRGFFFSHIGWFLCEKHSDVLLKENTIDISDLQSDKILQFQDKYFFILMPLCCIIIPAMIPVYMWHDTWTNGLFIPVLLRWILVLNGSFFVNSAAHFWGNKPYDKNSSSVENLVITAFVMGEGWHNFHHTFPWDYRAAELGNFRINISTILIELFAKIGWTYNLKTTSNEQIQKRCQRTGDGSYSKLG